MDEIATRKWERAKEQSPVVFAAGAVSLFATWLFQNNPPNLVSEAVLKEALTVTVCILIGMGVFYSLLFLFYKVMSRLRTG